MFTLDELRAIMRTCGVEDGVDLDADITDVPVADLGYDSLAMLHICGVIQEQYRVSIPDDLAVDLKTPGALLEFVNAAISSEVAV